MVDFVNTLSTSGYIPESYSEYEKIEQHIDYSERLYFINCQGKHILNEIEKKKNINGKKKLLWNVGYIYNTIENIVKKKALCNNSYTSLIHYLDELLFLEVKTYNKFVIEDDSFPLSYVYFNQHEWIKVFHQNFILDSIPFITILDAMLINCFVDDYEELILELEDSLKRKTYYDDDDPKLRKKIFKNIKRLKKRLIDLRARLLNLINSGFSKKIDL